MTNGLCLEETFIQNQAEIKIFSNINLEGIKCCETYRTNELALKTKYNYKIYTTTQDKGKYKKEQIT